MISEPRHLGQIWTRRWTLINQTNSSNPVKLATQLVLNMTQNEVSAQSPPNPTVVPTPPSGWDRLALWTPILLSVIAIGISIKAIHLSKKGNKAADEANEIARMSIKEELSGAFEKGEHRPTQRYLQDWDAYLKIQNTGGRDLGLDDLELTFDDGKIFHYKEDYRPTVGVKHTLPLQIKAQDSLRLRFEACSISFFFIKVEGDRLKTLKHIRAIDYRGRGHQFPESVIKAFNAFIHEYFKESKKYM